MEDEEEVYPSIGDVVDGRVLVCHGDDMPEVWIDWLEPMAEEVKNLIELADEHDVSIDLGKPTGTIESIFDFLSAIRVDMDSEFWEGSMTSGHYQFGWIKKEEMLSSRANGKLLVKKIKAHVKKSVSESIIKKLKR